MHEFSTAVNIIEAVKKVAQSHGVTRVSEITLQIGKLSMLNHDQLLFGLEIAAKNSVAEGARITIEPLSTKIRCRQCSTEAEVTQEGSLYEILSSLTCPKCGVRDVEVIQGRECVVKDIKAVVEEAKS
ncbi:MAG: hydrogenase maturation nickel metallochaperone HypA [Candidatus Thorarchaeota archaeon]